MILQGRTVALPARPLAHERFEAHVAADPGAVAVVCAGTRLTYAELNERANRFAHFLIAHGHGRGAKVGVCLDYSPGLLVAILGTLKAGAAYVPLDPAYPAARLRSLLGGIPDLALIVASAATAGLVESAPARIVDLDELAGALAVHPATDPRVPVAADDLCYAVFTSGSTGTPKLTGVRHEGWFNLMHWLEVEYGLHRGSHHLVVSAFGFDLSQRSLMTPLFVGATQHLMPSRNFDALLAYRVLSDHEIRTVHCASSTLYLLVDWEIACGGTALSRLDHVLFGGEPLKYDRIAEWARREGNTCTLLHQYGVAECTDVATSYDLAGYRPDEQDVPPVGRPAFNTAVHLVDDRMRGVGPGEHGEICISGKGVGAGYLGGTGPESERFTTVVIDGEPRPLYRTGDRGHVTAAGDLVVSGRLDAQVKVRGMRIDPTEVERALARLPEVREAAVVTSYSAAGEAEMTAFLVPAGDGLDEAAVRARLLATLPRNMVPARLLGIEHLPLSPHGKVDRAALAEELLAARGGVTGRPGGS